MSQAAGRHQFGAQGVSPGEVSPAAIRPRDRRAQRPLYVVCSRDCDALILRGVPTRTCGALCSAFALALAVLYLWCPVHRFPAAQPFHGSRWYNPYADLTPQTSWHKANLHAHSRVWHGLTNGHGSAEEALARYGALGYDVAPTSNYQEISRAAAVPSSALTVYEQGYNARKVHFLAVAPRSVDWLDYPLLQGRDEEQHRIDRLASTAGLVILAHPRLRNAVPDADLRALTGYAAMEIGSNASRGEQAWNVALDAGRPVWGVANDDTHHVEAPNEIGRYWTMIAAPSTDGPALQDALRAGRAYAVFGRHGRADIALRSFTMIGDTLTVVLDGVPAALQLIGPGGRVLETALGTDSSRWVIPCDAAWVRVAAHTRTSHIFLEPVLRTETGALPRLAAEVAPVPTYTHRALAVVLVLFVAMGWVSVLVGKSAVRESLAADERMRSAA